MALEQICIIGGTFNPVHLGHLQMARSAQAQCMADEVWFLPTGNPWQKNNSNLLPAEQRVKLLDMAIQGVHSWRIETQEIDHQGPSYTVETLEILNDKHPEKRFSFVIGADQLANLTTWKYWESLFDFARIGVVDRPLWGPFNVPEKLKKHLMQDRLFRIPMRSINVSSSDIRNSFAHINSDQILLQQTALQKLEVGLPTNVFKYLMENPLYGRLKP